MFSLLWSVTARAFDDDVEHHPDIVDLCKKWFRKEDLTDPCFKLALIPKQVRLWSFLICSCKRIFFSIDLVWTYKYDFSGKAQLRHRQGNWPANTVPPDFGGECFCFPGWEAFCHNNLIFCTCDKNDIILICGLKLSISSPLFFLAQGLQYFYT